MDKKTLRWLWRVPGRKKWMIAALTLVQALLGGIGVYYALLLRDVVDAAVAGEPARFWRCAAYTAALIAAMLALNTLWRWLGELSRASFENSFKQRLTDALLHKDYLRVNALHSGEWLNRLTSDTVVVANACTDIVPGFTGMAVRLFGAIAMLLVLQPRFTLAVLPGAALLITVTWLFRGRLKRMHKTIREADGKLRVFLQERLSGMLMLRSFAAEERTAAEAETLMERHKAARMRRNRFSNVCNLGFGIAMQGMRLLGVFWCGYGILRGTVSFGTLTAVMQLLMQIQNPAANITGYLPQIYAALASAERLMEIEQYPDGSPEALSGGEIGRFYAEELDSFGLSEVSFAYYPTTEELDGLSKEQMPAVLEELSFSIKKGQIVAFTGRSGCGKSTALKLLLSVYEPDGGERFYTDASGEKHALDGRFRRLFAYVPQGNLLMSGTVREIISFADPAAAYDEERLARAIEIAQASGFFSQLPNGMDTLLGERGTGLSEGQMQRLAIARAIFSDAPVLLLDEATSALDGETEKALLESLKQLTDKTVLIVTHRPAALSICDRVLNFGEYGVTETA